MKAGSFSYEKISVYAGHFRFVSSILIENKILIGYQYEDLFENLAINMIIPRYAKFQSNLPTLQTGLNTFAVFFRTNLMQLARCQSMSFFFNFTGLLLIFNSCIIGCNSFQQIHFW